MIILRRILGLSALLATCVAVPALAGTVNYTINFSLTSGSVLPTGAFTVVDGVTTASSLSWNGQAYSLPTLSSFHCPASSDGVYAWFIACGNSSGTWGTGPNLLEIEPCSQPSPNCYKIRSRSLVTFGMNNGNGFEIDPVITSYGLRSEVIGTPPPEPRSSGTWTLTSEAVAEAPEPSSLGLVVLGIGVLVRKQITTRLR